MSDLFGNHIVGLPTRRLITVLNDGRFFNTLVFVDYSNIVILTANTMAEKNTSKVGLDLFIARVTRPCIIN